MAVTKNPYLKALERYKLSTAHRSQSELKLLNIIEQKISDYAFLKDNPEEDQADELSRVIEDINSKSLELKGEENRRKMGAGKALSSSIMTSSKQNDLSSRIYGHTQSSRIQLNALSDIRRPTMQLESLIEKKTGIAESLTGRMQDLIDPETGLKDVKKYERYASRVGELEGDIAQHQLSKRYQKARGLDPIGIMTSAQETVKKTENILNKDKIVSDVKAGKYGSIGAETEALTSKFAILTNAISELEKATDKERDSKEKNVIAAEEDVKKQREVLDTTRQHGRTPSDTANMIGAALKDIAAIVRVGGETYKELEIANPLKIMHNQSRFMQMQNEQYTTMRSMTEGDQMSLIKSMGMYDAKSRFAEEFLKKGKVAKKWDISDELLGSAGEIFAGAGLVLTGASGAIPSGGATLAVTGAGALTAAKGAASGISSILRGSADYRKNIFAGGLAADAANQFESLFTSLNAIPAILMQAHEDQYRRSYKAGTGFGTTSNIMSDLTNYGAGSTLEQLSKLNVSPERAAMMTEIGGRVIGGKDFEKESMISAAKAEKAGIVSAEQYMQLLGGLSDIGGKDQNLFNTMKAAITVGMDDSKSINRMVSATVSLSDRSAIKGMMTAEGVTSALMRGADAFGGTAMTTSQRARVTQSQIGNISELLASGGTDIFGLQEFSAIRNLLGTEQPYELAVGLEKADLAQTELFRTLLTSKEGSEEYKKASESIIRRGYAKGKGSTFSKNAWVKDKEKLKKFVGLKYDIGMQKIMGIGSSMSDKGRELISSYARNDISEEDFNKQLTEDDRQVFDLMSGQRGTGTLGFVGKIARGDAVKVSKVFGNIDREVASSKYAVESERKYLEAKAGREKVLKAANYEQWEKKQQGFAENTILNYEAGAATEEQVKKARTWLHSSSEEKKKMHERNYQRLVTDYMKTGSEELINKTDKERQGEAGELHAPGALVDASETFKSSVDIFGKSIKKDFSDAITRFEDAIKGMEGKSSRPPSDNQIEKNKRADNKRERMSDSYNRILG